jgi:NADH-quinone oxidoreductase subunit M
MLGEVVNEKNRNLPDLNVREWAVFLPLIALVFWIGIYPKPFFDILDESVKTVVQRVNPNAATNAAAAAAGSPR